ncbi:MAG: hypothetical protein LBT87_07030, partial [Treponema sp.]|nr:hypothetical protein [Treponema sp.]
MRITIFFLIFTGILSGLSLSAGGRGQKNLPKQPSGYTGAQVPAETLPRIAAETGENPGGEKPGAGKIDAEQGPENPESPQLALPRREEPDRGERIMKALAQAYPDRLGPAEYRDGDWAVPVRGEWY